MQCEQLNLSVDNMEALSEALKCYSDEFAEPLSKRIDFKEYSKKVLENGYAFIAKDCEENIKGLVCGYANDLKTKVAFESTFVIDRALRGSGAAQILFEKQLEFCKSKGMDEIIFTTNRKNIGAARFYQKMNIPIDEANCTEKVIAYRKKL